LQGSSIKVIALVTVLLPHKESLIPQHMTVNSDVYVRWDSIDQFWPAKPCFVAAGRIRRSQRPWAAQTPLRGYRLLWEPGRPAAFSPRL